MFANNPTTDRLIPFKPADRIRARALDRNSDCIQRMVFFAVLAATVYQAALCLIHTHLFNTTTAVVGFAEFCIYALCFALLLRRVRLEFATIVTLVVAYLLLLAALRSYIDYKGFRDLMIPILFYWIGRSFGDISRADKILKAIVIVVLIFGCFEMFLLDVYSRVFNIFSYYVSQGGLSGATNWAKGSQLALNGIRPEGIGRTILPGLLGNHRISSVFMEPVSLGNFATITAAWALSKGRDELRMAAFFMIAAAIMIAMADSRYGAVTVILLALMRLLVKGRMNAIAIVLPLLSVASLIAVALFPFAPHGDNIIGRLSVSGQALIHFDVREIIGLGGFSANFGDMGYAISLTRFGILLCTVLWIGFWLIRMQDERGIRFRAYVAVYASLILMVSGTSLFALKTAGILWFLVGCCALGEEKSVTAASANTSSSTP